MLPLFESMVNFTDLRAYLAIAVKHRRLMVLCVCLGLAGGLAFLVYKRPVYYARALVQIHQEAPLPVDAEVIFRDSSQKSIIRQLNAPHIMERAARQLGIPARYNTLMQDYIKRQRVEVNSEYNIEISVWPYSLKLAREWTKALTDAYLTYRDEKRFEYREQVMRSYSDELQRIREKMAEFEHAARRFAAEQDMDDVKRKLTELAYVPARLAGVNAKLAFLEPIRNELESDRLSVTEKLSLTASTRRRLEQLEIGQIIPVSLELGETNAMAGAPFSEKIVTPDLITVGEPWQVLEREQRTIARQLAEAEKVFLPGHRTIVELKQKLEKINSQLAVELDVALNRFRLEYAALVNERQSLEKQMAELQAITQLNADLTRDFNLIQLSRLNWEKMFHQLATTLEKVDFGADRDRVEIQYMGLLEFRDHPVSPNKQKVFMWALLIGLGLAVALPFLLEYLDDTIVVDEQVERLLKVRTIAVIPEIEHGQATPEKLVLRQDQADRRLAEYFRVLRVNLVSNVHFEGNRQVFMITSALPKEGKSIIALNLAIAFARLGEKTLLLDADLRRGSLHRMFNAAARPGLSQLLESPFNDDVPLPIQQPEANLDFIPCGRRAHAAAERLESDNFGRLMQAMRKHYARIIIDTPPVLGLAETVSLVKHVDGVILVVWSGNTAFKAVQTAKNMLEANGAKFFGCALNKLDLTNAATYYYYYYYSYKYYQAYHHADENPSSPINA